MLSWTLSISSKLPYLVFFKSGDPLDMDSHCIEEAQT